MARKNRTMKDIESLLPRIKDRLISIYGKRLKSVILYGSFARNKATKDSDIDIVVVLEDIVDRLKEVDVILDALYDLELESGELISVYPASREELENQIWPLYYHIRTEGIAI